MPDWLQHIIKGDAAKTVGIQWSAGEAARLQSILRAKAERHDRKFDKIQFKGEYEMKHKEAVLEALKSGAMTIDQLEENTGIKKHVLYSVTSALNAEGAIERESINGGRERRYALRSNPPKFIDPRKPVLPPVEKAPVFEVKLKHKGASASPMLGMFKAGDKFLIQRGEHTLKIFSTTQGLFNLATGEPEIITPEESVHARLMVNLKAEILQSVAI